MKTIWVGQLWKITGVASSGEYETWETTVRITQNGERFHFEERLHTGEWAYMPGIDTVGGVSSYSIILALMEYGDDA